MLPTAYAKHCLTTQSALALHLHCLGKDLHCTVLHSVLQHLQRQAPGTCVLLLLLQLLQRLRGQQHGRGLVLQHAHPARHLLRHRVLSLPALSLH
jgi:hypothetical protein